MSHQYQWHDRGNSASRPQVSVRDYHYTTISITQLSLTVLETFPPAFIFLTFLFFFQNKDPFPFSCTAQPAGTEEFCLLSSPVPPPIPSLLSFFPASSTFLLTLLCMSPQNPSALMCSFTPSLPVWYATISPYLQTLCTSTI